MSDKEKIIEGVYICYVKVKEILDNNVGTAIERTFNFKCRAQKGFKYITEAITKRAKQITN